MKIEPLVKNVLIANLILIGLIFSQKINSQNIYWSQSPKGEVNLFTSFDESNAAKAYNSLKTRQQRDSLIRKKLDEDWTHTIPASGTPPNIWVCHHFTSQLITNSHDWGDGVFTTSEKFLYNGFRGNTLDSIYKNGGTLRDMGKLGIPMWDVSITDPVTIPSGHALVAVLTGDDFTKWEDWNIIEVQFNNTNVQPGDGRTYMPKDCDHVCFGYQYITINEHGQKVLNYVIILEFSVKGGIPTLTYNVNNGTIPPNYNNWNPRFDTIFHVIEKRDTKPPVLNVVSPVNGSTITTGFPQLNYTIEDDNFRLAWFSMDGGKTKTPIEQNGTKALDLPNGIYNLTIQAEDNFRLTTSKSITFTINKPTVPTVTTNTISDITNMTATSGGIVTSNGGADILTRGVCWSANPNPTISDNVTYDGSGVGSFSSSISKLFNGTVYHVRAYATNSVGTGYGEDIMFTTLVTGINEIPEQEMHLYPNPTNGYLRLELDQRFEVGSKFEILDYCGRTEFQINLGEGTRYDFDLTHLRKGLYFVRIQSRNSALYGKIVIQ